MAAGTPLATTVTGAGTDLQNLMVAGLVTGAAVGAAQSTLLSRGPRVSAAWTAVSAAGWSLGWLASWSIRVDVERGYSVFGASGALLVTVLTGLALRGWQPPRRPRASPRCRRRRRRDGGGPPARCALPSARAQAAGSPGLF